MDPFPFHQSLLDHTTRTTGATTTTTYGSVHAPKSEQPNSTPNIPDILFGMFMISLIATVAIWANHEASKGFSIKIINDAGKYSLPGKRFSIFYESNDKATRTILNTSRFVEHLLYPNHVFNQKKQINSVTLKLAAKHFPAIVSVESRKAHEYMIILSPSLMETSYKHDDFVLAVLQGVARVWLWDGDGSTPAVVLNGMVEYITTLAGFRNSGGGATMSPENDEICWKDEDPRKVAAFLRYHDKRMQLGGGGYGGGDGGYGGGKVIRRLNDGMRNGWHDGMMDDAIGMTSQHACEINDILTRHHNRSSSI